MKTIKEQKEEGTKKTLQLVTAEKLLSSLLCVGNIFAVVEFMTHSSLTVNSGHGDIM